MHHTIAIQCAAGVNTTVSPELAPFSFANPRTWIASGIQTATNGATITVKARGNLGTATKFLALKIDGETIATNIFGTGSGATNCSAYVSTAEIAITPTQFLRLTTDGALEVRVEPSISATSAGCPTATLTVQLSYTRDTIDCNANGMDDLCDIDLRPLLDCNENRVIDACEGATNGHDCDLNGLVDSCEITAGAEDENQNGKLDVCELFYGDLNLDGNIDGADLGGLLGVWGVLNPPYGDLNGDHVVAGADLGILLGRWGVIN
jgi:hypothetical protein